MFDEDEGKEKQKKHMIGINILIILLTFGLGLYFELNGNEDEAGDNHYEENYFLLFYFTFISCFRNNYKCYVIR